MSPIKVPTVTLNNGQQMPVLGLGTYLVKKKKIVKRIFHSLIYPIQATEGQCEQSIKEAIDAGYRHIDTAFFYGNEIEVGNGIRAKIAEGVIKREDVFIVTKLWNSFHAPDLVKIACEKSIANLNLGPIDLYLMHSPMAYKYTGGAWDNDSLLPKDTDGKIIPDNDIDFIDTWHAMEQLQIDGLVRGIGVSNFNSQQIERLMKSAKIPPVTNQIECSPNFNQKKLIKFCKDNGIVVTAYSPLGRPYKDIPKDVVLALYDTKVKAIQEKYNKSSAQVILRYLVRKCQLIHFCQKT